MSKCSECPFKMYPLLTGDCPEIKLDLRFIPRPQMTIAGPEPNQFCFVSCSGSKQDIELHTCKFYKIPESYWRQRYLIEQMGWEHDYIHK